MSIMQEYEAIKKQIGIAEWNLIEKFLESHDNILLSDVLYNKETYSQFEEWKTNRNE